MSAKSTSTTTVMRMKMRSRSSAPGAGTPRRIDTKLEEFLAQQFGGPDLVDFYDSESCVQDNHDKTLLGKFKFKVLIVCRDRVYICDNPPKDLSSFIMFDDIAEIKIVYMILLLILVIYIYFFLILTPTFLLPILTFLKIR